VLHKSFLYSFIYWTSISWNERDLATLMALLFNKFVKGALAMVDMLADDSDAKKHRDLRRIEIERSEANVVKVAESIFGYNPWIFLCLPKTLRKTSNIEHNFALQN
jgi:hypothetical protein